MNVIYDAEEALMNKIDTIIADSKKKGKTISRIVLNATEWSLFITARTKAVGGQYPAMKPTPNQRNGRDVYFGVKIRKAP